MQLIPITLPPGAWVLGTIETIATSLVATVHEVKGHYERYVAYLGYAIIKFFQVA